MVQNLTQNKEYVASLQYWLSKYEHNKSEPFPLSIEECASICVDMDIWVNGFFPLRQEKVIPPTLPKRSVDNLKKGYNTSSVQDLLDLVDNKNFRVHDFYSESYDFNPQVIFLCEQHKEHILERKALLEFLISNEHIDVICKEGWTGKIDYDSLVDIERGIIYLMENQKREKVFYADKRPEFYILKQARKKGIPFIFNDNLTALLENEEIIDLINKSCCSYEKGDRSVLTDHRGKTIQKWVKNMFLRTTSYVNELTSHKDKKILQIFGALDYFFIDHIPQILQAKNIPYLCLTPKTFERIKKCHKKKIHY